MVELSRTHDPSWHFDVLDLIKVTLGSLEDLEMTCDEGPQSARLVCSQSTNLLLVTQHCIHWCLVWISPEWRCLRLDRRHGAMVLCNKYLSKRSAPNSSATCHLYKSSYVKSLGLYGIASQALTLARLKPGRCLWNILSGLVSGILYARSVNVHRFCFNSTRCRTS